MKVSRLAKHECGDDENGVGNDEVVYYVCGETTSRSVLSAVDSTDTSIKVQQRGEPHPDDDPMAPSHFCVGRSASWLGINSAGEDQYIVTCKFKTPSANSSGDYTADYEYEWDVRTETVNEPTDLYGNVIVNAAGDPIDGGAEKTVKISVLTVYERIDEFDPDLMALIVDTVNSEDMVVLGRSVDKGQMRCASYRTTKRQAYGSEVPSPSEYVFEIKKGYRPWDDHRANIGFNGYYQPAGGGDKVKGPLVHGAANKEALLDVAVRLTAGGMSMENNVRVGRFENDRKIETFAPEPNPYIDEIRDPEYHDEEDTGWMEFRVADAGGSVEAIATLKERLNFIDFFPFFDAAA